jgi:hypothetical protein
MGTIKSSNSLFSVLEKEKNKEVGTKGTGLRVYLIIKEEEGLIVINNKNCLSSFDVLKKKKK